MALSVVVKGEGIGVGVACYNHSKKNAAMLLSGAPGQSNHSCDA
jgi:hypothetical protein